MADSQPKDLQQANPYLAPTADLHEDLIEGELLDEEEPEQVSVFFVCFAVPQIALLCIVGVMLVAAVLFTAIFTIMQAVDVLGLIPGDAKPANVVFTFFGFVGSLVGCYACYAGVRNLSAGVRRYFRGDDNETH